MKKYEREKMKEIGQLKIQIFFQRSGQESVLIGRFQTEETKSRIEKKHDTGDAKGDKRKKEKTKNMLNQMETGSRKTCVRKIKTREKRKTQRTK